MVSGYSGGDVVAREVGAAMNMDKSFYLPRGFAMMETANNPGQALALPGIQERLEGFAQNMLETLCR